MINHIEQLVKKAAEANAADEAMCFSQAALNASNALRALQEYKSQGGK